MHYASPEKKLTPENFPNKQNPNSKGKLHYHRKKKVCAVFKKEKLPLINYNQKENVNYKIEKQ